MSITSRINEMSNHIEQAYDELQGLGADLTNVNKNIENISMVLDNIYDSMPQVSGEGTSLTLDDTRVGKIKSTLKGNTSQSGTPTPTSPIPVNVVSGDNEIIIRGKNIFQPYIHTDRGITSEFVNGEIHVYGTATSQFNFALMNDTILNGTYTFSLTGNIPTSVWFWNKTTSHTDITLVVNTSQTITYNSNNTLIGVFTATNGASYDFTIKPMISSTATEYEPYQGNTYNIDLGVENLWDTSKLQSGYLNQSGSYPTTNSSYPNARYRLVYLYKGQSITTYRSTSYGDFRIRYIDVDTNLIVGTVAAGDNGGYCSSNVTYQGSFNNGTITALKDVILGLFDYSGGLAEATITYGTKIQTITPNPIELCKIGNYQDYFYKDSGKWYLHKEIGKVVLDGSENWTRGNNGRFDLSLPNSALGSSSNNPIVSTHFVQRFAFTNYSIFLSGIAHGLAIIYQDITDDLATFKTWLSNNNVGVCYALETPTTTEITYQPLIDQLNELEKAMSKDSQTNISQVNNDLPFIISASALKEWQENTSLNSTLSMVNPLSLGNTLNTQENNIQPIEVDNIEPLEEEENEES